MSDSYSPEFGIRCKRYRTPEHKDDELMIAYFRTKHKIDTSIGNWHGTCPGNIFFFNSSRLMSSLMESTFKRRYPNAIIYDDIPGSTRTNRRNRRKHE